MRSHPTRVRGLKQKQVVQPHERHRVAPHAGAWIETLVRLDALVPEHLVAPHAGAWIETCAAIWNWLPVMSHPTRVRGLKHVTVHHWFIPTRVAPHAGAWIETSLAARMA